MFVQFVCAIETDISDIIGHITYLFVFIFEIVFVVAGLIFYLSPAPR